MILQQFYPKIWADSAYTLPYEQMKKRGVNGLIFDVDNTLAFHNAPADEKAVNLFNRFHQLYLVTKKLPVPRQGFG